MNDELMIMLYLDGLLDGEELADFEARLQAEPLLLKQLKAQKISGAFLRAEVEEAIEHVSFERLHERVTGELPLPKKEKGGDAWYAPIYALWRQSQLPIASALVAALLTLFVVQQRGPGEDGALAGPSVELEEVSGAGAQTILIRQPAEAEASPVIWLLDEETGDHDEETKVAEPTRAKSEEEREGQDEPHRSAGAQLEALP